jgi:hypothetical protein
MGNTDEARRQQARKLLDLGWRPSIDQPGRVYPMEADMPSALIDKDVWWAMHEILAERER